MRNGLWIERNPFVVHSSNFEIWTAAVNLAVVTTESPITRKIALNSNEWLVKNARWFLGTFFFVGAVNNAARLPWHLWTRNRQFFVGCIWGLRINGGNVEDLPGLADDQQVRGVKPGCITKPLACAHPQCSRGVCEDRTVGFICVCINTSYSGKLCDEGLFRWQWFSINQSIKKISQSKGFYYAVIKNWQLVGLSLVLRAYRTKN